MADVDRGFGDGGAIFEVVGELCDPILAQAVVRKGGL